jgi:hypothetical protein
VAFLAQLSIDIKLAQATTAPCSEVCPRYRFKESASLVFRPARADGGTNILCISSPQTSISFDGCAMMSNKLRRCSAEIVREDVMQAAAKTAGTRVNERCLELRCPSALERPHRGASFHQHRVSGMLHSLKTNSKANQNQNHNDWSESLGMFSPTLVTKKPKVANDAAAETKTLITLLQRARTVHTRLTGRPITESRGCSVHLHRAISGWNWRQLTDCI